MYTLNYVINQKGSVKFRPLVCKTPLYARMNVLLLVDQSTQDYIAVIAKYL